MNMDYEKQDSRDNISQNPRDIIEKICRGKPSSELIFQIIEIIKKFCLENDEKT